MRTPHLAAAMAAVVAGVFGYAAMAPDPDPVPVAAPGVPAAVPVAPSASAADVAFDVSHLLRPEKEYLGVSIDGAPQDMSRVEAYAKRVAHKPNMITIFESFDDGFAAAEVRRVYQYGALPVLRWEPFNQKMSDIAAGKHDEYVRKFAQDVRRLNLPIALTVAHEMNGHWYSWGTAHTKPKDYVAGWRHLHDVFRQEGATNVIWTWTPNVVNYLRQTPLKPLWPGDRYVDWVGIDGYFTYKGDQTYKTLYGPTMAEIRKITRKPMIIVETGSEPGAMRARAVGELFTNVAEDDNVIGFVYFNQKGSANWVVDFDDRALKVYRTHPDKDRFGFPVT